MARIRTIKPEFWKHEELSALPEATHMLAAALLNMADDEGYFNANPKLVKAECSPLREPSVSVQDSLTELARAGYLEIGTGPDGKRYGHVLNFSAHQRINRKTESKIKKMSIVWDASLSPHTQLTEPSHLEGKGKEGKGKQDAANAAPVEIAPIEKPASEEAEVFRRGKTVLGTSAGGLIKRLIAAKDGNFALARAALEVASTKHDPREYIGAIVNKTETQTGDWRSAII